MSKKTSITTLETDEEKQIEDRPMNHNGVASPTRSVRFQLDDSSEDERRCTGPVIIVVIFAAILLAVTFIAAILTYLLSAWSVLS